MITRRIVKIMSVDVLCPKCGHKWHYSGCAIKATCPSCYAKIQVKALPDPVPAKVPAGVKALGKKALGQLHDGQTIQVKTQTQATGRVQVQSFSVPASKPIPVKHPRSAFSPEEQCAGHVCHHCHRPIKYPKMGYWVDGICMHRPCLVDEAIQEACGDLQKASQDWDIPLDAVAKRSAVLKEKGKLNLKSNIA
jgi:hypothetical protein